MVILVVVQELHVVQASGLLGHPERLDHKKSKLILGHSLKLIKPVVGK